MVLRRILLGWLATVAVVATGCSDDPPAGGSSLPDAGGLLRDAAAASKDIESAHFTLTVNGAIDGLPVHSSEGDLTKDGAAKGTVDMDLLGQLFEGEFVLVDRSVYIKGPTGGYQKLPAALVTNLYDPSAILNPDKGIANVLANVQNPKTEAKESTEGASTYKVTGRASKDVVSGLVPGVNSDVDITFWLREDNKQPVKASVAVPGSDDKPASVDVTLSDVDKPVTITAPA
ncbi:MAG TPA: LppX_LprAFG lipoprotein [Actinophytocola sp.]|uniref:LppX_LprAFG lipoprotein n=1 Tax=Actinophytocola sp. TaxID=1872138 RepID=UPI002DBF8BEF|nr:LppX_LprAFG lipoprotein [Actinophytocola sp.]HEU5469512.1 LppX_LprAFG lipoprotein [Actinophytocola sp.]